MDRILALLWTTWVLLAYFHVADSCSCQVTHPQTHYCDADFAILARVKKETIANGTTEYKIKIRKEYKMSEKAYVALKYGRLLTASDDSLCGVRLQVGKVYAVSGKIISLQARINMCGLWEKWEDLTRRQRQGLKSKYRRGCACKIQSCPPHRRCTRNVDACNWTTWHPNKKKDCQRREGICMRFNSKKGTKECRWARTADFTSCTKNQTVHDHRNPKYNRYRSVYNSPSVDSPDRRSAR